MTASTEHEQRIEDDATEHTVRELVNRLSRESAKFARQELDLATTEMKQRAPYAAAGVTSLVIGGALGLLGFAAFTAAIIIAIALALAAWAAALIVAVAYGILALIALLAARGSLRRMWPLAPQTVASIKDSIEWAKSRTISRNDTKR
ncbi:MAG: phage holin family protein [Candidatus Tyrphobacter sp.]